MSIIEMKTKKYPTKLPTGSSKLFGSPDVWDEFEWPVYTSRVSGDEYDMNFMCQINCRDLAALDTENLLPHSGVLYFFYNMDEEPATPNVDDAAAVLYYDKDTGDLSELRVVDDDGEELTVPEMGIVFESAPEDAHTPHSILSASYLDEAEDIEDFSNEEADDDDFIDDEPQSEVLLQLSAFETDELALVFEKGRTLYFLIEREQLENRDFSDVRVMIL